MTRGDNEPHIEASASAHLTDEESAKLRTAEVVPFPARHDTPGGANDVPHTETPEPAKDQSGVAVAIQQALSAADSAAKRSDHPAPSPEVAKTPPDPQSDARPPASGSPVSTSAPVPSVVNGGGGGGNGASNGGGGGGGGGGSTPLHKRSSDNEFRDVLGKGLANARRNLVTVGIFSVAAQSSRPRDPRLPFQHVGSRDDQQKHRHTCHADDDRRGGNCCTRPDGHDAPDYPHARCG